jgi:5,10-methylenetetrahydromethanopterin reductase
VAGHPTDRTPARSPPRLTESYAPAGLNHALVSFTDPFTLESWAGREVEGVPDLVEQVRLVGEEVLPQLG